MTPRPDYGNVGLIVPEPVGAERTPISHLAIQALYQKFTRVWVRRVPEIDSAVHIYCKRY